MSLVKNIISGSSNGLLSGLGNSIKSIRESITGKEIITTEERKLLIESLRKAESEATHLLVAQTEINKIDAESTSAFRGNWRPAIGWVCVSGLVYQYFIVTLFPWIVKVTLLLTKTNINIPDLPNLDISTLFTLLFGMLGLGTMRTFEKVRGIK